MDLIIFKGLTSSILSVLSYQMFEPVSNMKKLQMQLRCKKQQQDLADSALDLKNSGRPPKKRKFASSISTACHSTEECPANDVDNGEVSFFVLFPGPSHLPSEFSFV